MDATAAAAAATLRVAVEAEQYGEACLEMALCDRRQMLLSYVTYLNIKKRRHR
jgi:hypothetical protein